MLILNRKVGERVVINGDLVLTVIDVGRNGQVRLGFDGPKEYRILRAELLAEILAENVHAQAPSTDAGQLSGLIPSENPGQSVSPKSG